MTPTPDQIQKLPKWAQEHLRDLSRQREEAVRTLNKLIDEQTPSKFSIEAHPCLGENPGPSFKTRYIQTDHIKVAHAEVELHVLIRDNGDNGSGRICLQWNDPRRTCGDIQMKPVSFQSIELQSKENMR